MKHSVATTLLMLLLFLGAQIVGLSITTAYMADDTLYVVAPPEIENENLSFIPIILAVVIGTALVLLLAKYRLYKVWKVWFFLSIFISLLYALYPLYSAYVEGLLFVFILVVAGLAYLKLRWTNVVYQNVVELLVYGGIIALFMPLINVFSAVVLLVLMSIYDVWAVRQSKHMIALAEFQTSQKAFAGLNLTFGPQKVASFSVRKSVGKVTRKKKFAKVKEGKENERNKNRDGSAAILGGGDIAFPLLFSTALAKAGWGLLPVFFTSVGAAVGLGVLLFLSTPKRYYPALPFVSVGGFLAAGLLMLL